MSDFVATGLLATSSSSSTLVQANSDANPPLFSATGLLNNPDLSWLSETSIHGHLPKSASVTLTPRSEFTATALLSNDTDSTDYDLPSVADIAGTSANSWTKTNLHATTSASYPRSSVRATTFDGKTIFMKKRPKSSGITSTSASSSGRYGNLLDVPIHRLMDQLSLKASERLRQEDRISIQALQTEGSKSVEDTLWVDRYRPHRFYELIGNERVAREAMAWVKQWDWCVFGRRSKKRSRDEDENSNPDDEYHRPRQRLLLLSGPPGLGKTTMAHVIARQAGYEVMEINASDARSGQIIDDRIRPALESGSAVGRSKPVLLVIDEIDGATGAGESSNTFIHKLVQLTSDKPRKKPRPGQKRVPDGKRPILRPIICICNDHNASSLAKLRPHAYQLRFTRPSDVHTVRRLQEICEVEGLKTEYRALSTLVSVAKGDLRGCLNTLQFIQSRSEEVTETMIRGATAGMKEADASVTSVLNDLFNPLTKKRTKELALSAEEEGKYVARLSHEIDASGREIGIAIGCFAHYATLHQFDANFSRYEKANEWLVTYDTFSSAMYTAGEFVLNQYTPYFLVPFYPLFQERGGQRVDRSQADWDNLQLTRTNEEIYKSISRCAQTPAAHHFRYLVNTPTLQLEFAPYLNRIISPPLRPVNSQVIRPEEKAILTRLVDIMTSLELRFVQERSEDGQLSYRLDPPIDVFVTYDAKRAVDIAVSRYAIRHIVAQEIDARLLARDADIVEKRNDRNSVWAAKKSGSRSAQVEQMSPSKNDSLEADSLEASEHPNKRAKSAHIDIADKPPTDFFGRLITVPSISTSKAAARKNVDRKYRVTFKFTEGNSAAVRKPVKVGTFL